MNTQESYGENTDLLEFGYVQLYIILKIGMAEFKIHVWYKSNKHEIDNNAELMQNGWNKWTGRNTIVYK